MDNINHPQHYTQHPSGVECITITEHMSFNIGNAMKYLWRCGAKGATLDDLRKAVWYVQRELARLEERPAIDHTALAAALRSCQAGEIRLLPTGCVCVDPGATAGHIATPESELVDSQF